MQTIFFKFLIKIERPSDIQLQFAYLYCSLINDRFQLQIQDIFLRAIHPLDRVLHIRTN
jgi:hypothetical protein